VCSVYVAYVFASYVLVCAGGKINQRAITGKVVLILSLTLRSFKFVKSVDLAWPGPGSSSKSEGRQGCKTGNVN
jgi:hypothetical protein